MNPVDSGRVTRFDVIVEARSWLHVPYIHQHRDRVAGVDCVGLLIGVARALGLVVPDFDITGYERRPDGKAMLELCDRFMTRVPLYDMRPGHALVLRFDRDPQHIGIVGDYVHGGLSLIHAYGTVDGKGKVVEHRLDPGSRVMSPIQAYALPGVL